MTRGGLVWVGYWVVLSHLGHLFEWNDWEEIRCNQLRRFNRTKASGSVLLKRTGRPGFAGISGVVTEYGTLTWKPREVSQVR